MVFHGIPIIKAIYGRITIPLWLVAGKRSYYFFRFSNWSSIVAALGPTDQQYPVVGRKFIIDLLIPDVQHQWAFYIIYSTYLNLRHKIA